MLYGNLSLMDTEMAVFVDIQIRMLLPFFVLILLMQI
jgi:hypothetical protein